jgi:hypothetical protein
MENVENREELFIRDIFYKKYLEFRNAKGRSSDITIFKLIRGIFYSVSALFWAFCIVIFFLARNNMWSVEHSIDSFIFSFVVALFLLLFTIAHKKLEDSFSKIKVLKLEAQDKGSLYFWLDTIYFTSVILFIIFI